MPINKTIPIHSNADHLISALEYIENPEKTTLSKNTGKLLSTDEVNQIQLDKMNTMEKYAGSTYLENALKYAENELKTTLHADDGILQDKDILVSGVNCNSNTAFLEFEMSQRRYERINGFEDYGKATNKQGETVQRKPIVAYHLIQSFPKYMRIDPNEVHQIGQELVNKMFPDHQAVISTHMNTESLHNHVIICNYSIDGKHKVPMTMDFREEIRNMSDKISIQHGFDLPPVLLSKEKGKTLSWIEWNAINLGEENSWKEELRKTIDVYAKISKSQDDFIDKVRKAGYLVTVKNNKITYELADGTRKVRDTTLGENYTLSSLQNKYWPTNVISATTTESAVEKEKSPYIKQVRQVKSAKIYVSKYTATGRKRSDLERAIIFAIKVLKRVMDKFNNDIDDNSKNPLKHSCDKKIKDLEKALEIAEKYEVTSKKELERKKEDIAYNFNLAKKQERIAREVYDSHKKIQSLIAKAIDLKTVATSLGVEDQDLFLDHISDLDIRHNRAKAIPATGKMRRDLFKLLEAKENYRMLYKMDELTYDEIKATIDFLTDDKNNSIPFTLCKHGEYTSKKAEIDQSTDIDAMGYEQARLNSLEKGSKKFDYKPTDVAKEKIVKELTEKGIILEEWDIDDLTQFDVIQLNRYLTYNSDDNPLKKYFDKTDLVDKMLIDGINDNLKNQGYKLTSNEILTKTDYNKVINWINKGCNADYKPKAVIAMNTDVEKISPEAAKQISDLATLRNVKLTADPYGLNKKEAYELREYLLHQKDVPEILRKKNIAYKQQEISILMEPVADSLLKDRAQKEQDNYKKFMAKMDELDVGNDVMHIVGEYRDTMQILKSVGIDAKELEKIHKELVNNQITYENARAEKYDISKQYADISKAMRQYDFYLDRANQQEKEAIKIADDAKIAYNEIVELEHIYGLSQNQSYLYGQDFDKSITYIMTDQEIEQEVDQEIEIKQQQKREL